MELNENMELNEDQDERRVCIGCYIGPVASPQMGYGASSRVNWRGPTR